MKAFKLLRHTLPVEHQGGTEPHNKIRAEGTIYSDGSVSVRWFDEMKMQGKVWWDSYEAFVAIHITSHPDYGSEIVWFELVEVKE